MNFFFCLEQKCDVQIQQIVWSIKSKYSLKSAGVIGDLAIPTLAYPVTIIIIGVPGSNGIRRAATTRDVHPNQASRSNILVYPYLVSASPVRRTRTTAWTIICRICLPRTSKRSSSYDLTYSSHCFVWFENSSPCISQKVTSMQRNCRSRTATKRETIFSILIPRNEILYHVSLRQVQIEILGINDAPRSRGFKYETRGKVQTVNLNSRSETLGQFLIIQTRRRRNEGMAKESFPRRCSTYSWTGCWDTTSRWSFRLCDGTLETKYSVTGVFHRLLPITFKFCSFTCKLLAK